MERRPTFVHMVKFAGKLQGRASRRRPFDCSLFYSLSSATAMPWPTPMHMVASA